MAVPAHKTEYFIIENSNLQKKANTPGNRNIKTAAANVMLPLLFCRLSTFLSTARSHNFQ